MNLYLGYFGQYRYLLSSRYFYSEVSVSSIYLIFSSGICIYYLDAEKSIWTQQGWTIKVEPNRAGKTKNRTTSPWQKVVSVSPKWHSVTQGRLPLRSFRPSNVRKEWGSFYLSVRSTDGKNAVDVGPQRFQQSSSLSSSRTNLERLHQSRQDEIQYSVLCWVVPSVKSNIFPSFVYFVRFGVSSSKLGVSQYSWST